MVKSKEKYNFLVKKDGKLIPATDEDSKFIFFLDEGAMVKISTSDVRQLWRHRKFFKLLQKTIEYMPEKLSEKYPTTEKLLIELKLQLGMMDIHVSLGGKEIMIVKNSISFENMGEKKFTDFVNSCRDLILKHFLKGMTFEQFNSDFMSLIFD